MTFSRRGRYMDANHSTRQPARHIFVDCESRRNSHNSKSDTYVQTLRLWAAQALTIRQGKITNRKAEDGTSAESFWHWVYGQCLDNKPVWIWAHNASVDMTWLDLWNQIDDGNMQLKYAILEKSPFLLHLRYCKTNIRVVDSCNWFKQPLANLGKMVGLEKLPIDFNTCCDDELLTYCKRDVEILERTILGLLDFCRVNDLGMFRPTAASQAYAAFRHWHKSPKIVIPEDQQIKVLEREAYYGGRCELGFCGHVVSMEQPLEEYTNAEGRKAPLILGEKVYYMDFNSAYPSVMRENPYPTKFVYNFGSIKTTELANLSQQYLCIAKVLLNQRNGCYPMRDEGEVIYPEGRFWTALCGPELDIAIKKGDIEKVGQVQCYQGAHIFRDYVDRLYSLRKEYDRQGNTIYKELCKCLLNSLYGKFGQHGGGWRDTPELNNVRKWGTFHLWNHESQTTQPVRFIAGHAQTKFERGETLRSFPAISAFATSYARCKLASILDMIPKKCLYYWDTDCVHVNDAGYRILVNAGEVDHDELGKLSLKDTYDHVEYINSKIYIRDGEYIIAGTKKNATLLSKYILESEVWDGIATTLVDNPYGTIVSHSIKTELSQSYNRRAVSQDGWTRPLYISRMGYD